MSAIANLRTLRTRTGLAILLLALAASASHAAWVTDGNPVCTLAPSLQSNPAIVWSFDTKAIVFWSDTRAGAEDLYGRFIDSTGTLTGPEIVVAAASSFQNGPVGLPDGGGGAIVTWMDARSGVGYDIYAQRLSITGAPQWTANGIPVVTAAGHQRFQAISGDGLVSLFGALPGAYVAWQDDRTGTGDIYAQHLSSAGAKWAAEVPVCTAGGAQTNAIISSDGLGQRESPTGALVAWVDGRGNDNDIYAQRLSSAGVPQWAANGVPVCTATGNQGDLRMVQVGSGNSVYVWTDLRSGTARVYAQKLDPTGAPQWGPNGIEVAPGTTGSQTSPVMVARSGGVLVTWSDTRNGNSDIYAQRLDATGVAQWQAGGIPIGKASSSDTAPLVVSNANGVIVCWAVNASDLYAQRVTWNGEILWPTNGIPVSRAAGVQSPAKMITDGGYGATVAWQDTRAGNNDIYALRIGPQLVVDVPRVTGPAFALSLRSPNPTRGAVTLDLTLQREARVSVAVFDLAGRVVATLADGEQRTAGHHALGWNGRDAAGRPAPAGVYMVRASNGEAVAAARIVRLR